MGSQKLMTPYGKKPVQPMDVVPTWGRVARVWWAVTWRWVLLAGTVMVVWMMTAIIVTDLLLGLPTDLVVWPIIWSSMAIGLGLLIIPLKLVIGSRLGDFRLELTPYYKEVAEREQLPGFRTIIIEGKIDSWYYPYPMTFTFNGEPMYRTAYLSAMGDLKVTTLDGEEVARCAGKTVKGKYAIRLESALEGDRPIVFSTGLGKVHFYINDKPACIETRLHKQVVKELNLEVTIGGNSIRAVGDRTDAAALSPPMLVGLLGYTYQLKQLGYSW